MVLEENIQKLNIFILKKCNSIQIVKLKKNTQQL